MTNLKKESYGELQEKGKKDNASHVWFGEMGEEKVSNPRKKSKEALFKQVKIKILPELQGILFV